MTQPAKAKLLREIALGRLVVSISLREALKKPSPGVAAPARSAAAEAASSKPQAALPEVAESAIPVTPTRKLAGQAAGAAAIACMLLSGYQFIWTKDQSFVIPYAGLQLAGLGALLLGAAVFLLRPQLTMFRVMPRAEPVSRQIQWLWVWFGVLMLAALGEINAGFLLKNLKVSQHVQMLLFIGGIGAVAAGLGAFRSLSLKALVSRSLIPIYAITLLALILRVVLLSEAVHVMVDELHLFDAVAQLWGNPNQPMLHPMNGLAAMPFMFAYFQQLLAAIFGADFFGIRLGAAIVGTLTIPALYLLAKWLFDDKTAIIAALLLAIFPAHIHFSRLAIINIADPLFGTLALAFLVRALRTNAQSDYVLAGVNLALVNYFYEGGRLLFVGVFVLWLGFVLVTSRPRKHRRGMLLMGATALLIVMPYYYSLLRPGAQFASRFENEGVRPKYLLRDLQTKPVGEVLEAHWTDALQFAFYHTIYSPDSSQFYYGGYTGILHWYVVPFYFLGLVYGLWRLRSIGVLLWLWVACSIIGISFVVSTDWTVRFEVLFPVMMLIVAVGLRYPLEMIWPAKADERIRNVLFGALILLIGTAQLTYYWGDHLKYYNEQVRRGTTFDFYDAFDRASDFAPLAVKRQLEKSPVYYLTDQVVFTPVLDNVIYLEKLNMLYEVWGKKDTTKERLAALPRDRFLFFAITPEDTDMIELVRETFGSALQELPWSPYPSVPRQTQYSVFVVKP